VFTSLRPYFQGLLQGGLISYPFPGSEGTEKQRGRRREGARGRKRETRDELAVLLLASHVGEGAKEGNTASYSFPISPSPPLSLAPSPPRQGVIKSETHFPAFN